jgi:hypothetical protein
MGEAALAGVPIVCTDVGASFRVVTDVKGDEPFSAIVGTNDVYALARAQIDLLALLDDFGNSDPSLGGAKPTMPHEPTPADVERVTQRMYDGMAERRRLGFLGRKNVLESFSEDRYLREHEQMLCIGKHASASYNVRAKPTTPTNSLYSCSLREKYSSTSATSQAYLPCSLSTGRSNSSDLDKEPQGGRGCGQVKPIIYLVLCPYPIGRWH